MNSWQHSNYGTTSANLSKDFLFLRLRKEKRLFPEKPVLHGNSVMMPFSIFPAPHFMLCCPRNMTMGNDQSGERDSFRNIETYARLKMDELGLADWQFGWDRAKRRLGVCRLLEKSITISIHFVRANLETPHEIRDTILHEIAHALAWIRHGERTHGPRWKQICREIGAVPCASAKPDAIRVTTYKYLLRLKTTGEIVGKYHRRPSFAKYLKRMALKGRPDTLGQLELAPYEE
ncbi:MAG: SprT-like domain-containing protein [Akkermansia muciniphila]|uniref:SprT-like domain-containing protein n=1 Tax=uncultured Akkermansia sp. TaxID=512294 RepID=UPI00261F937D|nr:SprT-like domain-containing protein [uncultured Akkermansia sp.]